VTSDWLFTDCRLLLPSCKVAFRPFTNEIRLTEVKRIEFGILRRNKISAWVRF